MNDRAAQLASSFARAQQLTKVVASPEFDKYAKGLNDSGFVDSNILSEDYRPQEMLPYNPNSIPMQMGGGSSYNAEAEMQKIRNQGSMQPARNNIGLPKQILDEIRNNPLTGLTSDPTMDAFTSQLASVTNMIQPPAPPQQQPQRKPTLSEQFAPPQQPMQMASSNFDYETMKMLIEGVVKKYIEPLKENLLNESVNRDSSASLKMMKLGKNFQFMDSSGNIYEATMVFKGNIKDKKNKKPAN